MLTKQVHSLHIKTTEYIILKNVLPKLPLLLTLCSGHYSIFHSLNNLPSDVEVPKPIQSFLGKAFALQIEQNL